ncbi:hypothetical protein E2C01_077623 [Portunus trituberculatus]|uniref:Uncharacterized protein n=1 Tax=Portunus trituberculatus TaxID=210409 RepID=A0A5B7IRT0_PORTR|nr:hypothetical protein [Portunus trituberculatus]
MHHKQEKLAKLCTAGGIPICITLRLCHPFFHTYHQYVAFAYTLECRAAAVPVNPAPGELLAFIEPHQEIISTAARLPASEGAPCHRVNFP